MRITELLELPLSDFINISEKLQKVESGEIKRLMVFLPPRSSKSVICSKLFPAWYVGRHPQHEILTVSHSDQLASDFGRSVRDLVNFDLFNTVFPDVTLRSDVRAAGKWKTNQGGTYYAAGVRSQIAGRGAHVAILDDVMSEEDSFSETGRRYVKEWYPSGLRTRIMPNGSILIINTRYHYDDLCGWLLKQQENVGDYAVTPWDVVRIPAWLDEESASLLQLPVGSSYFPAIVDDSSLAPTVLASKCQHLLQPCGVPPKTGSNRTRNTRALVNSLGSS